jgi:hypothetical protein
MNRPLHRQQPPRRPLWLLHSLVLLVVRAVVELVAVLGMLPVMYVPNTFSAMFTSNLKHIIQGQPGNSEVDYMRQLNCL